MFNVPPTAKVIWRRGHGLKSHPKDWRSWESNLRPLVYKASDLSTTPQRLLVCAYNSSCTYLVEYGLLLRDLLNPFMPNVFSPPYQLDESISNFRVVGWYFSFLLNFKRNFCKQTVDNLIRRCIMQRLIWFCTVCRCPTKRRLGLYGLRIYGFENRGRGRIGGGQWNRVIQKIVNIQ